MPDTKTTTELALFDFDGTITSADCYTRFVFFTLSKRRLLLGGPFVLPIYCLYKFRLLKASKTRPIVSRVAFWRRKKAEVMALAADYVATVLPKVMRVEMLERIQWHKRQGHRIYVVSASLNPYLEIWCAQQGIGLICSELTCVNGRYTGKYVRGDCSEERKVSFLQETVDLSGFSKIYAYGDTPEDFPMLALADVKYYQGKRMV